MGKEKEKIKMSTTNGNSHGHRHGHGRIDYGRSNPAPTSGPLKRSAFRAMVQDFVPLWFTWSMNSGIIAILLHQHPYRFNGINTLACIFFGFDILCFIIFSITFLLRIILFPRQTFDEITGDVGQMALLACWPIAWLTLTDLVALLISTAYWGQYWATLTAYVMWWIAVAWIVGTIFFVFIILTRRSMLGGPDASMTAEDGSFKMPTLVIIPAVGVSTTALTGAIIMTYGVGANARLAIPVIIMSFVVVGFGIVMGCVLVTLLWYGFLVSGFPEPAQTPSFFVLIGPMGQSAAALLALGTAASESGYFAEYNRGTFITGSSATALSTACTLIALMLLGVAAFFFLFSLYAMVERLVLRQMSWNMTWNSIIFPTGTMTTATTLLSTALDSPAFAVLTSIQLVFLVIVFLVNLVATIIQIFEGQLLIVREDPRVRKELEEMEKEK